MSKNISSADGAANQLIAGLERLGQSLRAHAWSEAFARGLTPTQGQVLNTLRTQSANGLRLSDIATALRVTPATASEAVQTLVNKGLVKKAQAAGDGRAVRLSLTRSGVNEALAVARWPGFLLEAVRAVPEQDRAAMLRGVISIISLLQRSGHIPVAQMCVTCRHFRANVHRGDARPHHCELLQTAIGDAQLRVHCPEHELGPDELQAENWAKFNAPQSSEKIAQSGSKRRLRVTSR